MDELTLSFCMYRQFNLERFLFQVLKFGSDDLLQRLTFCEKDQVLVGPRYYDSRDLAENWVKTLWGETTFELKEESSSVEESALEERFGGNESVTETFLESGFLQSTFY